MEPADWDRVFVTDFATERAWLSKASVVRLRGRPTTDDAGLGGDELAVFLVTQANGFRGNASAADPRA
jgi:hypothetical protein